MNLPGTIHAADDVALQAQSDLTIAYNTAAGLPCTANLTGQDLGGLVLTPGAYCFSSSAQLTGTLTLDAQGDAEADFVFKTGSTLTTASASTVVLINQAQACRVFHQVGSSATLGTGSQFVGTILALTSITATTATSVQGRLLARNGAVTLDSNTVTRPVCLSSPVTTTSITVASTSTTTPMTTTPTTTAPATLTSKTTVPSVTAATLPARGSSTTPTTRPPSRTTSRDLASTGGQFAVPVAAGVLAIVAGAMILCAPRLRVTHPGERV